MKEWLKCLFAESNGVSSKRFVGIISGLVLCLVLICTSFTLSTVAPPQYLVDAVLFLSLGGLGLTSLDKFVKYKDKKPPQKKEENTEDQ